MLANHIYLFQTVISDFDTIKFKFSQHLKKLFKNKIRGSDLTLTIINYYTLNFIQQAPKITQ
jgi:hypothetical protein